MAHNILLIQGDAAAVGDALLHSVNPEFHVDRAANCAAALERLAADRGRLKQKVGGLAAVLVDLELPDSHGMATFNRIFAEAPQIPILILTTLLEEETAKRAVKCGAQDYFFKDRVDLSQLPKILAATIDRVSNNDALFEAKERAQVTLDSIGDAVISTDIQGKVTYLNIVAERLTGWRRDEAAGRPFKEVFKIIDSTTRETAADPMALAIHENRTLNLAPNCILTRRDGIEAAIEDSAAPIHDRRGQVTGAVMVFHDVSAARALAQQMAHLAQHDSLTDLPNRALLNDRLAQAMALSVRHGDKIAVLLLDVDRFKHINDSLGRAMGDRLLRSISRRLACCVRATDTVCRQGGDEFIVFFSDVVMPQDAAVCAEKILAAVSEPHQIDEQQIHVTASIGIVIFPDDGSDSEVLLKNADFAMYQAKNSGRNNYRFYESELNSAATERQSLENSLRHAIERHEFELHYQPKIRLETGRISAVEALLRWRHPQLGLIPPAQFIAIAEESGLIVPIGQWVLREGCRQATLWRGSGLRSIRLAVNVSAVELRSKYFAASVQKILDDTGFDPRSLELELTETFLMQDSKSTVAVLRKIKDMGIQLALDDFGTGYSSLSYMRRFPIDTLKVDQSFIRDLTTDADDASIVDAVISMGKSLHMRVVAEGVETLEQLRFLERHLCPEAQGYYFSRPVAADAFAELVRCDRSGP
jgi:diguanylate cyclase (GGDEF)-like protein/PAS domain S-box-containing protein